MSHVKVATTDEVRKILWENEGPVLIKFWASWCRPCLEYGPEYEKAASLHSSVPFLSVNGELEPALIQEFNIRSIPCTIIFKAGREMKRKSGFIKAEDQFFEF